MKLMFSSVWSRCVSDVVIVIYQIVLANRFYLENRDMLNAILKMEYMLLTSNEHKIGLH